MATTDWVTIRSFDHRAQADLLLLVLEQRGLPARLADEHIVAMKWTLANAIGGIKVQVPAARSQVALEIASTILNPNDVQSCDDTCLSCGVVMSDEQSICPECGWTYQSEADGKPD